MLHTIYPVKSFISRYSDTEELCFFCKNEKDLVTHLFFECKNDPKFFFWRIFWQNLSLI